MKKIGTNIQYHRTHSWGKLLFATNSKKASNELRNDCTARYLSQLILPELFDDDDFIFLHNM